MTHLSNNNNQTIMFRKGSSSDREKQPSQHQQTCRQRGQGGIKKDTRWWTPSSLLSVKEAYNFLRRRER